MESLINNELFSYCVYNTLYCLLNLSLPLFVSSTAMTFLDPFTNTYNINNIDSNSKYISVI